MKIITPENGKKLTFFESALKKLRYFEFDPVAQNFSTTCMR
jgi:hypothetical protein